MASKTLVELRNRSRQRANMERSGFVTDSELNGYINTAYRHLYDILINSYGDEYFSQSTTLTKTGDSPDFDISSLNPELYKVISVCALSSGIRYPIKKIDGITATYGKLNTSITQFELTYVPMPVELNNDNDAFEIQNGWDDYITASAAIKCLIKEESDIQLLMIEKGEAEERLRSMARSRDIGQVHQVVDIRRNTGCFYTLGYFIKAGKIVITNIDRDYYYGSY